MHNYSVPRQPQRHSMHQLDRRLLAFLAQRGTLAVLGVLVSVSIARANIYQWQWVNSSDHSQGKMQSSTLCPGGSGVSAVPGANLASRNLTQAYLDKTNLAWASFSSGTLTNGTLVASTLTYAIFEHATLTGADFSAADLTGAQFSNTNLTNAVFSGATITGANFFRSHPTATQIYSTTNYQAGDLHGIALDSNSLASWDLSNQNLTGMDLRWCDFTGTNVAGATIAQARLNGSNFAADQLYSTASYKSGNLNGTTFPESVVGWNFAGKDLTHAYFQFSDLTGADFTGAIIVNSAFDYSTLTPAQLYSTGSYQTQNIHGLFLRDHDMRGWNLANQNLSGSLLQGSNLTAPTCRAPTSATQACTT